MGRMENSGGDRLARGASSYTFRPMGENLSRDEWANRVDGEKEEVKKAVYKFTCPIHGEFQSDVECFISGGYPQLDENKKGLCTTPGCENSHKGAYGGYPCVYAGYVELPSETNSGDANGSETAGDAGSDAGKTCEQNCLQ
jgi:hypothetical protein